MPHDIRYDTQAQIVEITGQGTLTLAEIKEIYSEGLQLAVRSGCRRFLSNYRGATLALSTVEIYGLHQLFEEMATSLGLDPPGLKRVLIPADEVAGFRFFETVSANRGYIRVRMFQNGDDARLWLARE
jgi:hypothetical protein